MQSGIIDRYHMLCNKRMESIHSDHVFNVTTENIVNEDVIGINDFINIHESDKRLYNPS